MTRLFRSTFTLLAAAALATLTHAGPAPLDAAGSAQLEALQQHPESAGAIIYRGNVVPLGAATPLYRYERRVATTPEGLAAAHITRELGGDVQHTAFTLTPSSPLVRMLVAPLTVSFDTTSRNVIRYEGRVPPMQPVAGKLEPLAPRVDYTLAVAAYR